MPYQKIKEEEYRNFGGINNKVSPYQNVAGEVLDMFNLDFVTPGSLTKRPGSTQFLSAGQSNKITGIYDAQFLNGASYMMAAAGTNMYYVASNVLSNIQGGLSSGSYYDFQSFVDRVFFCQGSNFMKWKGGATATLFSLPTGFTIVNNLTGGTSNPFWASATLTVSWGYVNDRGYYGPPGEPVTFKTSAAVTGGYNTINFANTAASGVTTIAGSTYYYLPIPASFGVGFTIGMTFIDSGDPNNITGSTTMFAGAVVYRDTGPGTARFASVYVPIVSVSGVTMIGIASDGGVFGIGANDPISSIPEPTSLYFTLAPSFLEIFNNQLIMGGFSSLPSTVFMSDVGEPESVQPENFFEVRTNDGDRLTGSKSYLSKVYVFKERSFHSISGDTPENLSLREESDQYGCLNKRCIVVFDDTMLFLDRKGVAQFNGANTKIISSEKMEPVFKSMNLSAARTEAVMIHNRLANQIWIGLPINGSTTNNVTVVYDYLLGSWTKYDGFRPSSMAVVNTGFTQETPVFGNYSGMIHNFNASLMGDNGSGFTCLVKTRFFAKAGQSTQETFRRLWLDVNAISGATGSIEAKFFQDYGASVIITRTISQEAFQSRTDFGISAKALSVQIKHFSATEQIILHGLTIGSRFSRDV